MPKFKTKPVEVEAWQWLDESNESSTSPDWIQEAVSDGRLVFDRDSTDVSVGVLRTLEGEMSVRINDWIVKDAVDELTRYSPNVFQVIYERIVDVSSSKSVLDFVTFSQIIDELTERYKSGVIIISKEGKMQCGEWGPDHDKLGLMQIVIDTIVHRNRDKYCEGLDEDR